MRIQLSFSTKPLKKGICCCSVTKSWPTLCDPIDCSMSDFHLLHCLMSILSEMLSNRLILCHPLLLLPSIFPSIRVFSNKSALRIRWPKYWVSASASVLPMNIQSWFPLGLTGFDLPAVQGTLKSIDIHINLSISFFLTIFCFGKYN